MSEATKDGQPEDDGPHFVVPTGDPDDMTMGEMEEALADSSHPRHVEAQQALDEMMPAIQEVLARLGKRVTGYVESAVRDLPKLQPPQLDLAEGATPEIWLGREHDVIRDMMARPGITPNQDVFAQLNAAAEEIDWEQTPAARTARASEEAVELQRVNLEATGELVSQMGSVADHLALQRTELAAERNEAARFIRWQKIWVIATFVVALLTLIATVVSIVR